MSEARAGIPEILWRRRRLVICAAALTFAAAAAVTFLMPKVYESRAYVLVAPAKSLGGGYDSTQLTQILNTTYAELVRTEALADEVQRRTGVTQSKGRLTATVVPSSQLLALDAEGSSAQQARRVADAYAAALRDRVAGLARAGETTGEVQIAAPATLPASPSRPAPKIYLAVGLVLALFAAALAAVVRDRLDQRVRVDATTLDVFGFPIVGRIPRGGKRPLATSAGAEAARLVVANLRFLNSGSLPWTVAVVSSDEGEGRSMLSLLLAAAAAELGRSAVVVETDLRRPSLASRLDDEPSPAAVSLSSLMLEQGPVLPDELPRLPGSSVDVLPAGAGGGLARGRVLASPDFAAIVAELRERYELVIFDTPPLSAGADASIVASSAEATLLVVDPSVTRRGHTLRAVDQLTRAGASVAGVVVNRASDPFQDSRGAADRTAAALEAELAGARSRAS